MLSLTADCRRFYATLVITILLFELFVVPVAEAQYEYDYYFGKKARKNRKKRIKKRQKKMKKKMKKQLGKSARELL